MRYLCLVYLEEKKLNALPRREYDALVADALAYDDELRKSGHYLASDALQPVDTATPCASATARSPSPTGLSRKRRSSSAGLS